MGVWEGFKASCGLEKGLGRWRLSKCLGHHDGWEGV